MIVLTQNMALLYYTIYITKYYTIEHHQEGLFKAYFLKSYKNYIEKSMYTLKD